MPPEPTGSLFPSLDGGDPGEQLPPQDITDSFLPGLSEPSSAAQTQGLSMVPEGAAAPASPAAQPKVDEIDLGAQPAGGRKKRTLQDRIDKLTAKVYETRDERDLLAEEVRRLSGVVATFVQNGQPQQVPPAQERDPITGEPVTDVSGGAAAPAVKKPSADLDVAKIVESAIARYDQKKTVESSQINALRAAHEASFEEACAEFPELRDKRTMARQTFDKIFFGGHPLAVHPNGPYQVALMVRGALASESPRQSAPNQEARKRQMTASAPVPAPVDVSVASRADLEKRYNDLMGEVRKGNNDFKVYRELRYVRAALKNNR